MDFILDSENVGKLQGKNYTNDNEEDWDNACDEISSLMGKQVEWYCEVKNFGWDNRCGYLAPFYCDNGKGLLRKVLPNTECTFNIFRFHKNGIAIQNFHHDSATGNEWYYIVPATAKLKKSLKV